MLKKQVFHKFLLKHNEWEIIVLQYLIFCVI